MVQNKIKIILVILAFISCDNSSQKTTYYENGNVKEKIIYDKKLKIPSSIVVYTPNGELKEEKEYNKEGKLVFVKKFKVNGDVISESYEDGITKFYREILTLDGDRYYQPYLGGMQNGVQLYKNHKGQIKKALMLDDEMVAYDFTDSLKLMDKLIVFNNNDLGNLGSDFNLITSQYVFNHNNEVIPTGVYFSGNKEVKDSLYGSFVLLDLPDTIFDNRNLKVQMLSCHWGKKNINMKVNLFEFDKTPLKAKTIIKKIEGEVGKQIDFDIKFNTKGYHFMCGIAEMFVDDSISLQNFIIYDDFYVQ